MLQETGRIQNSVTPVTNGSARSVLPPLYRFAVRHSGVVRRESASAGRAEPPRGQPLTLDLAERAKVLSFADAAAAQRVPGLVTITLNGEPYQLDGPVSVSTLLAMLAIDARRVAVEHNLVVVRRAVFDTTMIGQGDEIEIVNFVGGG
jgi:sulfur carrier protein